MLSRPATKDCPKALVSADPITPARHARHLGTLDAMKSRLGQPMVFVARGARRPPKIVEILGCQVAVAAESKSDLLASLISPA